MQLPPASIEEFLAGIAVEACVAVATGLTRLARRLRPSERNRITTASIDERLQNYAREAMAAAAAELDERSAHALTQVGQERLATYLGRLFEWHLVGLPRDEFRSLQSLFRADLEAMNIEDAAAVAELTFSALGNAADRIVTSLQDSDYQVDPTAVEHARTRVETVQLEAINDTLALMARGLPRRSEYPGFISDLRRQVHHRHRHLTPPDFEQQRRVAIEQLYTEQILSPPKGLPTGITQPIPTRLVLDRIDRLVVLGSPGAGKSTFANYCCWTLTRPTASRGTRRSAPVPLFMTLRKWATKEGSLTTSLYEVAASEYQVDLPDGFFEWALGYGLVLPIFDGLDELLDLTTRRDVASTIEAFAHRYPLAPVLVTSREVGYSQAPLAFEEFDALVLREFDNEGVVEYVTRWFSVSAEDGANGTEQANSFLNESRLVDDLRRVPLLLALMCILYRGRQFIPENRPEVYEECSRLLFKDWDRHRHIHHDLPYHAHIDYCLQHLAWWIFGDPQREEAVAESEIVRRVRDYFAEWVHPNIDEAHAAAQDFVAYCRGRAWILSGVGSTPGGEELYQFTHRTFLEHFTGTYLARTSASPTELAVGLAARVVDARWEVVAQIAIHRKSRDLLGAADEIIGALLESASDDAESLLAFLGRLLVVVSAAPPTLARLCGMVIQHDLENVTVLEELLGPNASMDEESADSGEPSRTLLSVLLEARSENIPGIAEGARAKVQEVVESGSLIPAALSVFSNAAEALEYAPTARYSDARDSTVASPVWEAMLAACSELLQSGAHQAIRRSRDDALSLLSADLVSLEDVLEQWGPACLFLSYRNTSSSYERPMLLSWLGSLFAGTGMRGNQAFADLWSQFLSGPQKIDGGPISHSQQDWSQEVASTWWLPRPMDELTLDHVASCAVAICLWQEVADYLGLDGPRTILQPLSLGDFDGLKDALQSRSDPDWEATGVRSLGLPCAVEATMVDWARREASFLQFDRARRGSAPVR